MTASETLITDATFKKQARAFAKWHRLQRTAVLQAGKIAAEWLEHYSRERGAERLADALHEVTGVRVTGRTIRVTLEPRAMSALGNGGSWPVVR